MKHLLLVLLIGFFTVPVSAQSLSKQLFEEPVEQLTADVQRFGDPRRGALAYFQPTMNCARCHESQANGRRLGPDLSEQREFKIKSLVQSILIPSAEIRNGFETTLFQLTDGRQLQGILVQENDDHFVIDQIEQPDTPLRIGRDEVEDWKLTKLSSMPADLVNQLSDRQQFLDLISYLAAIAAGGPKVAAELRPANAMTFVPLPEYETRIDHAALIRSLDDAALQRGKETYRLRCQSCHGTTDKEGSMPTTLRFVTDQFKNGSDPYRLYQTLTHGYGMMNPQRWMVPQQKYEVIHYLREHFLKTHNPTQYSKVTDEYLADLPAGDTRGPKPIDVRPWTAMDYGPSLNNTIEISDDGSNIAQKGIAIRLDQGPGGVESGSHWLLYEHDTMRVAGAWSGKFIDWEGIHFNGVHGRHPRIAGQIQFANPTGPGFAKPSGLRSSGNGKSLQRRFEDNRVVGRDGKHYGPLPKNWARFLGMFRYGDQAIIKYRVGDTEILETPRLTFIDDHPVFSRTMNLGHRGEALVVQIASVRGKSKAVDQGMIVLDSNEATEQARYSPTGLSFDGTRYAEVKNGDRFDLTDSDYSIYARIKTLQDGTIFSQTVSQNEWIPQGKTFFLRGGRPTFDIGWVGAVNADRKVNDGKWHEVVMTWQQDNHRVRFYVDGESAGSGKLAPEKKINDQVVRIGFTNDNFPATSFFDGAMSEVRFYQRKLSGKEIKDAKNIPTHDLLGYWHSQTGSEISEQSGDKALDAMVIGSSRRKKPAGGLLVDSSMKNASWTYDSAGNIRLKIPAGEPMNLVIWHCPIETMDEALRIQKQLPKNGQPQNLSPLAVGGPANYPEKLTTQIIRGDGDGPFAVDVFERPKQNPWNCQLRLTGLDFLPGGNEAVVSAWDGSVWRISGFGSADSDTLTWQRIAAGLFQPLGIKIIDEKIFVSCRDQIVILHDLNGDGETDWYENFNSDHQVTEHFHEFAMGLQADEAGNLYYAKSARHALPALVPHHGTLLKVSPDGEQTEILANGFRAANGVCLNPDGSFVVTDQEGHWNPKNRINWVRPGGFYGNMFGYHDVTDESDAAMDDPLCWITNAFDRSPAELLWVDSEKWGSLNGSLLNFSYGYGQIHIVPHEEIDGQMQGGMCALPIEKFPTGVMRGRFHSGDGQLYCCGMFAWAGDQQKPGGLYRVRYTGKPVHLPIDLSATADGLAIKFSGEVDEVTACDPKNFAITIWDLKRTKNYGSKHFNERRLMAETAELQSDGKTISLTIPDIKPTWGMEISYSIKTISGKSLRGKIHNTIHRLK